METGNYNVVLYRSDRGIWDVSFIYQGKEEEAYKDAENFAEEEGAVIMEFEKLW